MAKQKHDIGYQKRRRALRKAKKRAEEAQHAERQHHNDKQGSDRD